MANRRVQLYRLQNPDVVRERNRKRTREHRARMKEKGGDWKEAFRKRRKEISARHRAKQKARLTTIAQKSPEPSKQTQHGKEVLDEYRTTYKVDDTAKRKATRTVTAQKYPKFSREAQSEDSFQGRKSNTVKNEPEKHSRVYGLRSSPKRTERGEELHAQRLRQSPLLRKSPLLEQSLEKSPGKSPLLPPVRGEAKEKKYVNIERYIHQCICPAC